MEPPKLTKKQLEELETQFSIHNMGYLQGLEHRITMKRMNQYPDFQSYLAAYEDCIQALDELKSFCSQSIGGQQWFSSMYQHCHNSRNRDFNLEQQIRNGYKELLESRKNYQSQFERQNAEVDFLAKHREEIREQLIRIIAESPGTLQKNIYKNFPAENKSAVITVLMEMVKAKTIRREKNGNSFSLFVT